MKFSCFQRVLPTIHVPKWKTKAMHTKLPITKFNTSAIREAVTQLESTKNAETEYYLQLLDACACLKLVSEGKTIHSHILRNVCTGEQRLNLLEKILCMYIGHGEMEMAQQVFDDIRYPSIFLWNSMIRGYAWNGPFDRSIDMYYKMLDSDVQPNKYSFPFVLKACSTLLALEDGKAIHKDAKKMGLDLDMFVCTALIDLYTKCGSLDLAHEVFNMMPQKDVVTWNAMVAGSTLLGLHEDAVTLILGMQKEGKTPNSSTLVAFLPTLGQTKLLLQGKSVHSYSIRRCLDIRDVLVGTALLDMYAKCGSLTYAQNIFNMMHVKNEVTWGAMIGVYLLFDLMVEAVQLFYKMIASEFLNPTPVSLAGVLRACATLTDLLTGQQIHAYVIKSGHSLDIVVGNTLLSMYAKTGNLDYATMFFNEMKSRDSVSYTAIISGCAQNGNAEEALDMFGRMLMAGVEPVIATILGILPACAQLAALQQGRGAHDYVIRRGFTLDIRINNALIDMYCKCSKVDVAKVVFNCMPERDIISWNAMIAGYGIHGLGLESISLYHHLQNENLKPDDVTFICLLSACCHSGLVTEGKYFFYLMHTQFNIIPRMEHYICMVDLFGRAGFLDEAYKFIRQMPIEPDVRVWEALLSACRTFKSMALSEEVAKMIQKLGPEGSGSFVLLSNIYSEASRWDDAAVVRIMQKTDGFIKKPGCSWIEINGIAHAFISGDRSHPQYALIDERLLELLGEMKKLGYEINNSFALHDVEEEEKECILLHHSEKLAVAYGLLVLGPSSPIRVTKNLRICRDCHTAMKFISGITKRVITVRDANRFHHFSEGICNCGDFW